MLLFCTVKDFIGAKMSKLPGPSRIPTFGTRIPQFGSASKAKLQDVEHAISSADVGKVVVAVGKVGILRFVGKVHFASGVWCGIELETDVGKNDGCIDGIRYFICSRGRGLMTPLAKVSVLNEKEKQSISHSRSSDSVHSIDLKNEISELNQDCANRKNTILEGNQNIRDLSCEAKGQRSRLNSKQVQTALNRERTFDKIEREENRFPKNNHSVIVCDKIDNKLANDKLCLENNNSKKEVAISYSDEFHYFRIPSKNNILSVNIVENPEATSSKNNNSNSLRLAEAFSEKRVSKIETCKEFFEKKNSSQTNDSKLHDSNNKSIKFNQRVELTNSQSITKKSSQLTDFKEKKITEITSTRNISSCVEEKEQSSENHNSRTFIYSQEEENKRDSLDLDESLEILTVSQMNDGFSVVESIFALDDMPDQKSSCQSPLPSSNFDLIINESAALINDTTINLDLPLDTIDKSENFVFARVEETPSPEELPLDPIPIIESEPKTETSKSKIESKTNSFIASITSITSLDTGYQGDGEMSRPGSRGADNSPLTRRPLQRPAARRTDAMTDSDFFTESDADNHDENVLKGDRKAQVIDGTLYGVDPQAAADIYVNNRENMDSSGVFTDMESNTRTEELLIDEKTDISPTDTSSKTLSENSQNNLHEIIAKNWANNEAKNKDSLTDCSKKRGSPSPVISNTSSTTSPLHLQREDSNKKYKTLKRDVQSKVKMLLETNVPKPEKKILKKPAGRWDAVMNKISKSDSRTNFQEVKSRVFNGVNSTPNSPVDAKKLNGSRLVNAQKSPNNKLRRIRTRVLNSPNTSKNSNGGSIHSSLSDLSSSTPKKPIGSAKKREVQQVTQVLTAAKLSPKLSQQTAFTDGKRRAPATSTSSESKTARKSPFSPKEKKQISNKENDRTPVKGNRASPVIRSPSLTRSPNNPVPKTAEALAVLLQHLVFNVGAFEVPILQKQIQNFQLENKEIHLAYQRLEKQLLEEKHKHANSIEEERIRWREDVEHLIENHSSQIAQIISQNKDSEEKLLNHYETSEVTLRKQYEEKLVALKREFERLQKSHEESLDILREENEAIREDIDAKNEEIQDAKHESLKLKEDYEAKESLLKEQIQFLSRENHKFKQDLAACKEEISKLEIERARLLEENKRLYSYGEGKGVGVQEVESLRVVLELKQNEVSDLRKAMAEATQKAESLAGCEEKAALLQARCEDLQLQLQRKNDYEIMLISENKKLEQSIQEEANQRRSISLRNEELQWKLKQNKEVITKILEQTSDDVFNKSGHLSTSFNNERYSSNTSLNISFKNFCPSTRSSISSEGAKKLKKTCSVDEDDSPPPSPKIKGVVEKSDSVSYVLDLDESPDVVASRLVRRSFRNSLNQKNTPTKSPCTKRPRMKVNPLSQSSSASSLVSPNKIEYNRSSSATIRMSDDDFQDDFNFSDNSSSPSPYHYSNLKLDESPECRKNSHRDLDYMDDHVLDLTLPALPSELGCKMGAQALPRPKHLAGEAMVSESNSDDESTSSSSGQL